MQKDLKKKKTSFAVDAVFCVNHDNYNHRLNPTADDNLRMWDHYIFLQYKDELI